MTISELIDAIEELENDVRNYVGGMQGKMNGNGLKVSVQKKIAALQKKLDKALGDETDCD